MRYQVLLLLLAIGICTTGKAQLHLPFRGEVPSLADARTPEFALEAGQWISVRPLALIEDQPTPVIDTYVYDDKNVLAGKDNEDSSTPAFEWLVPRTGLYHIVVRNTVARAGAFEVTLFRQSRGNPKPQEPLAVVRVFYGTNRQLQSAKPLRYSREVSNPGELRRGYSDISIPRDHRTGELEGPSVFDIVFGRTPDERKHVTIRSVSEQNVDSFYSRLRGRAAGSKNGEALVFVHGFAVSFDDSLRRAAQLAYDLTFDGPAIVFSWPTQEGKTPIAYNKDGRNSELSAEVFRTFLEELGARGGLSKIHVIAHSMGNRVVARALEEVATSKRPKVQELVLMAPDIDAALFRQLAPAMKSAAQRLTLYASSKDGALVLSQIYAGYPRAGQGGKDVVVLKGIETIDASAVDTSLVGLLHSYYADNTTILSDLYQLIRGAAVPRFRLKPISNQSGAYWEFAPAAR